MVGNGIEQLVVPFLTKTADERFAEVLVERHPAFRPFGYSAAAHIPLVIVDGGELAVFVHTDGVEVTGDGFHEVGLAVAEGLLYGAQRNAVVAPGHVGAFAVVDKGCARLGCVVEGGDPLLGNGGTACLGHIGFDGREDALQDGDLLFEERGPVVAFDAALPFALGKVAAETALGYVVGDDAFFYYQHGGFLMGCSE